MKKDYPIGVVYFVTILAMFFWSCAFIWVSQAYAIGFRPITVVFFRLIVASVVLTIITKFMGIKDTIKKEDYKLIFFLAFAEPFCYFLGESFGMLFVSPTLASILVSTIPLVTPIFAWMFLKEKVGLFEIVGLIVSFLGVVILVMEDLNLEAKLIGVFLMLIAVFGGTAYGILLKLLADKYPALTITKYQTYIGVILFMPLFFIFEFNQFLGLFSQSTLRYFFPLFKYILLLGALPSSFSFTFLAVAVRRLGVVKTNIFSNLIPVFTGLMAYLILKEPFSLSKMLAMGIVVVGLFVSQMGRLTNYLVKNKTHFTELSNNILKD